MDLTLGDLLHLMAQKYGDRDAVLFTDQRASFNRMDLRANQRANALLELGVDKGDHIAVLSHNCMELVETLFGAWRSGAVVVPINIRLSAHEMAYVVDHSDATILVVHSEFEDVVSQFCGRCKGLKTVVSIGQSSSGRYPRLDELTQRQQDHPPGIRVRVDDWASIIYTAGTTGRPKGVVATHGNWIWATVNGMFATWSFSQRAPKVMSANPFFHVGGYINLFWSIFNGGSILIQKRFDAQQMLSLIQEEGIERLQGPSTIYKMLLRVPEVERYDLSSVRIVGSGAEPMPAEVRERLKKVFSNASIWEFYGMTETCGVIAIRPGDFTDSKPGSVGPAPFLSDLRIVDDDGRELPPGEIGEIVVRGPHVMSGYYKDPGKTSGAIRDGWLHTQDLGRMDEDGFLYVLERKHNMIISGGENIYPREVEEVLLKHPGIVDAAVFGMPDELWGQRVCAAVVTKPGLEMTAEDVIDYCMAHLASFKKPRSVYFVESLPRSAVGKVLRDRLKEKFAEEEA